MNLHLAHDLVGGRVRLSADALIGDSTDVFFGLPRWRQVAVPTRLLAAQWSRGRDSPPAYDDDAVRSFRSGLASLVAVRQLAGVDHAASIMSPAGATAAAELVAAALA